MAYTDIDDPSAYFQTALFTGNGGTNAITNTGNSDLQPNMIWFKCRSAAEHHVIFDSVRGVTKGIYPNLDSAEDNLSNSLASFNSDGFTMGADTGSGGAFNGNTKTMAAWQWKESATAGFDIVGYTGNQTSGATLAHSLGVKPDMIITKSRAGASGWGVYHKSLGATYGMLLNTTAAKDDDATAWNDVEPDTSNITLGSSINTNKTGTMVCYAFAEKQGYSKFGSYTGNGNANGTFVYTGFKPAWILIKRSSTAGNDWGIFDNKRLGYNVDNEELRPSANDAEQTDDRLDILSNGFKIRLAGAGFNASGDTFIYMAFAESPFVTSTGVPATAR